MSEPGVLIGLISGIIQIISATEQIYEAVKDAKGQPTAFREVAARLPLVANILSLAKQKIENQPVDEQSSMVTELVVRSCEEKALQLKMTLEKCLPVGQAGLGTRIWKGMQMVPKGNRVETLMQGILTDIVMLVGNYGLRAATEEQIQELSRAIKAMGDLAPSACEEISSVANSSYGGGAIYSNTGTAPQQINNGPGSFYGNNVYGTVQTMFGGITNRSTMNFKNINIYQGVMPTDSKDIPLEIVVEMDDQKLSEFDRAYAHCRMTLRDISSDPREDRQELITRKGPLSKATCEWIFQNDTFKLWLFRPSSQRLWIPGKPGKGKTVLAIMLAEYLEFHEIKENCVLLEYYFNNTDTTRNNIIGMLRSLIFLILVQRPATFKYILKSPVAGWPFKSLCRIFQNMVGDPLVGKIFLVLDALDECIDGCDDLVCILRMLGSSRGYPAKDIHLLVLSRHHPTSIEFEFSSDPTIDLDNELAVGAEVNSFISDQVDAQHPARSLEDTWPSKLKEELIRKADDTFLWAGFALKELKRVGRNRTKSDLVLSNLPMGLNALYERILLQIEESDRAIAARLLECVVIAYRPLSVPELAAAIPIARIPGEASNEFDTVLDYINSCGSILELKKKSESPRFWKKVQFRRPPRTKRRMVAEQPVRSYGENFTDQVSPWHRKEVRLVHASAKQYLLNLCSSEQETRNDLRVFAIDEQQAHKKMVQSCLGTSTPDLLGSIPQNWYGGPLGWYANQFFRAHAGIRTKSAHHAVCLAMAFTGKGFLAQFKRDNLPLEVCDWCAPAQSSLNRCELGFRDAVQPVARNNFERMAMEYLEHCKSRKRSTQNTSIGDNYLLG